MFRFDEIERKPCWDEDGNVKLPEFCYECYLIKDVVGSYSKCMGDGKDIELPYEKSKCDCPIRVMWEEQKNSSKLERDLSLLKVLCQNIDGASDVVQRALSSLQKHGGLYDIQ